jgi:murein DD-endopeptidase MepM/ murein hydrolase activator NlpD
MAARKGATPQRAGLSKIGPTRPEPHEFLESGKGPDGETESQWFVTALAGIRESPFEVAYPIQKLGGTVISGYAGELRGFYHRSDGSDRWKPSWSSFGHPRNGSTHQGLDIYASVGTPVVAIADGYAMLYSNPAPGDELGVKVGLTITGSDKKKYDVLYGHLSGVQGSSRAVKKGEVIGYTGCTGNAEDGTCAKPNRCNGHSSHLHIAVRESTAGAPYMDPGKLFNWQLVYADDTRDVPCDQAFPSSVIFEELVRVEPAAGVPKEVFQADKAAGESKRFKLDSFSTENKTQGGTGLTIYEDLEITLTLRNSTTWPGVNVEIRGRERHFFHPATSRQSTYTVRASFENLGPDGNPTGDALQVGLTRIEGEVTNDTGLRRLYVSAFLRDGRLDLSKPIRFLGSVLEPA